MKSPEHNREREDAKKKRYLVIGVWIFSIIILIIWLSSLRFSFSPGSFNVYSQETEAWQEDLDESLSYFQENLNSLNQSNEDELVKTEGRTFLQNMTNNLTEQKLQTEEISADFQELELIKNESDELLKKLEDKINNNTVCPEFINCMPGPDRVGPCSVPPGCEDITQIAY